MEFLSREIVPNFVVRFWMPVRAGALITALMMFGVAHDQNFRGVYTSADDRPTFGLPLFTFSRVCYFEIRLDVCMILGPLEASYGR